MEKRPLLYLFLAARIWRLVKFLSLEQTKWRLGHPLSMKSTLICILVALISATTSFAQTPKKDEVRILFIGNSLTYSNGMPKIFEKLSEAALKQKLTIEVLAEPNFGLQDHWEKKQVVKLLEKKKWDFVIMQQGPSASAEGRKSLSDYGRKFLPVITKSGAKPVFYMVWPSMARQNDFEGVISSYTSAAQETNGLLAPVGCVWRTVLSKKINLKLYSDDGFHPSPAGSYLAAVILVKTLFGTVPDKLEKVIRVDADRFIEVTTKEIDAIRTLVETADAGCS